MSALLSRCNSLLTAHVEGSDQISKCCSHTLLLQPNEYQRMTINDNHSPPQRHMRILIPPTTTHDRRLLLVLSAHPSYDATAALRIASTRAYTHGPPLSVAVAIVADDAPQFDEEEVGKHSIEGMPHEEHPRELQRKHTRRRQRPRISFSHRRRSTTPCMPQSPCPLLLPVVCIAWASLHRYVLHLRSFMYVFHRHPPTRTSISVSTYCPPRPTPSSWPTCVLYRTAPALIEHRTPHPAREHTQRIHRPCGAALQLSPLPPLLLHQRCRTHPPQRNLPFPLALPPS